MKYRQLTKEQFESLHEDFSRFLATQKIDAKEWRKLKEEKPELAEEELNIFSDVVWDNVLSNTKYLEHFSENMLNLFECGKTSINRIVVKVNKNVNLITKEGYEWLLANPKDDTIEYFQGSKTFSEERNVEVFDLIEKGSSISKGELFIFFQKIIN